jgi:hypothetical protein
VGELRSRKEISYFLGAIFKPMTRDDVDDCTLVISLRLLSGHPHMGWRPLIGAVAFAALSCFWTTATSLLLGRHQFIDHTSLLGLQRLHFGYGQLEQQERQSQQGCDREPGLDRQLASPPGRDRRRAATPHRLRAGRRTHTPVGSAPAWVPQTAQLSVE